MGDETETEMETDKETEGGGVVARANDTRLITFKLCVKPEIQNQQQQQQQQ